MALSKLPLLIFLALMMVMKKVHSQVTIAFAFDDFDSNSTYLTYQGDANVPTGTNFVRLIKTDEQGNPEGASTGRVLFSTPLQLWESATQREASFETVIRFVTTPFEGDIADGMAFFIAPVNSDIPPLSRGGFFGVFNSSGESPSLFAVEIDTFSNDNVDPSFRHIGIDINSWISKNVTEFEGEGTLGEVATVQIMYDANTKLISVYAFTNTTTYTVTYVFDLRTILPERVQVGISAATGGLVGTYDVRTWYLTSTLR